MPPRTRKAAEPAASLEDATHQDGEQDTAPVATGATETAAQGDSEAPCAEQDTPSTQGADEPAEGSSTQEEAAAQVEAQTFHWESVKNDDTAPCRLCAPSGPPIGAGSFGCPHGQWVRVQDTP